MKYVKTFESYNDEQEYINDIIQLLSKYNISPLQIQKVLGFYADQITNYFNDGKHPKLFVDEIVNDLELSSGGFINQLMYGKKWQDPLKYF